MGSEFRSHFRIRPFLACVLALLFSTQSVKAEDAVIAHESDVLACGTLAEVVVLAVYYAPEIGSATGATVGAVHTQLAAALGISVEALEGYEIVLTALGVVASGHELPDMKPQIWFRDFLTYASKHTVKPMWESCTKVWDQYSHLPGDVGTLYSYYTGNGADGVALQGSLPDHMAIGKQCLVDKTGSFGALLGHLGLSYKAWRACRGCCDERIHDDHYTATDGGRADYFRNAPGWGSCMAVCNGLPHPNGDDRFID